MLPSLTDIDRLTEHLCTYKYTACTHFQGDMCAEVIGLSPEGRGQLEAHVTVPNEWLKMLPPLTDDDRRALDEIAPYFGHKCVHTLPTPIIFLGSLACRPSNLLFDSMGSANSCNICLKACCLFLLLKPSIAH